DPGEPDPWRTSDTGSLEPDEVESAAAALAASLESLPAPSDKRFLGARDAAVAALREMDWAKLVGGGFGASVLTARKTGRYPRIIARRCRTTSSRSSRKPWTW